MVRVTDPRPNDPPSSREEDRLDAPPRGSDPEPSSCSAAFVLDECCHVFPSTSMGIAESRRWDPPQLVVPPAPTVEA